MKRILHAGAGSGTMRDLFKSYVEVRLDIDPAIQPHIVADITNMGDIGEYDAIYCSHCLEHLYPHELPLALQEFLRVLKPDGLAFIIVPDLEGIQPTEEVVYTSVDGDQITGLDMIFGCRKYIAKNPHMAHHNGFTKDTLEKALLEAGFKTAGVKRHSPMFELLAVAIPPEVKAVEPARLWESDPYGLGVPKGALVAPTNAQLEMELTT